MYTGILGTLSAVLLASFGTSGAVTEMHGISNVRYEVTFDAETAVRREIHVEMSFDVDDDLTISLSLPSWTPGSYQLDDYAQNVRNTWASENGQEIHWDKADFDTWRVYPTGSGRVTIAFDYFADELDVGSSWASTDFVFFNGTNVFLFPEGQGLDFDAERL